MSCLRFALLLLVCLGQTAMAYPKGEWVADFYGQIGVILLDDSSFSFRLEEEGEAIGFAGPLVEVREAQGLTPGRLIVGPVKQGEFSYEVVWFFATEPPRARFMAEPKGYKTLEEARASAAAPVAADSSLFMTRELFDRVNALPPLPVPGKDELIALLREACSRQQANPDGDTNTLMETLMVDGGHHPTRSREPFEQALQQHIEDPEVARLVAELEKQ